MRGDTAIILSTVLVFLAITLLVAVAVLKRKRPGHRLIRVFSTVATLLILLAVANGLLHGIEMDV